MPDHGAQIAYYLAQYREGRGDDAFFDLLGLDHEALPDLTAAFRAATDASDRAFLLHVLWQHRHPSIVPVLAESLFNVEPSVWREALDGLAAIASPAALNALRMAQTRAFPIARDQKDFSDWLTEAIEQVEARLGE